MLFVLTPGVDWTYAIASALRDRRGVVPAVGGMLLGHFTATLAVAVGIAAVIAASETAMMVITLAGASYLIWLGIATLRRPSAPILEPMSAPVNHRSMFAKGIGISLLNPKVFLLFLALLPSFASTSNPWPIWSQMVVLGTLHVINCGVIYLGVGYGASVVLNRRPNAARIVGVLSGIVMILLGTALIGEKMFTFADSLGIWPKVGS